MKKKLIYIVMILFSIAAAVVSCNNDDEPPTTMRRSVMVYINAENNLYKYANEDLNEMVEGSKAMPKDCNLIVYIDDLKNPCIYQLKDGTKILLKEYSYDPNSSDPETINEVLSYMTSNFPANEYGTVFWGHGDGTTISNEPEESKAKQISLTPENETNSYGADFNNNKPDWDLAKVITWIDVPVLARVLGSHPKQEFIFFDACLMQSVENAYELKDCAEYIIGCCCETPSFGANYVDMVPQLFNSTAGATAKAIVNHYIDGNKWGTPNDQCDGVCISAIKTSEMDNLLAATKVALSKIGEVTTTASHPEYTDVTSCIFYYKVDGRIAENPIFYDIKDVMRNNLTNEEYTEWLRALNAAVIEKRHPRDIRQLGQVTQGGYTYYVCDWIPTCLVYRIGRKDFSKFYLSDDTFGGLSIFIPNTYYSTHTSPNMNKRMYDYKWCQEVGWREKGW